MSDDDLANAVTLSLAQYLTVRQGDEIATYNAPMEALLGLLEATFSDPFLAETYWRFRSNPTKKAEIDSFRIRVLEVIRRDPELANQLRAALGGRMPKKPRRGKVLLTVIAIVAVVLLGSGYFIGRSTGKRAASEPASTTVTTYVESTITEAPATSTTATGSSSELPSSSSSSDGEGVLGDGSTLREGQPVALAALPRPNDEWNFEHGVHDVQFDRYNDALWKHLDSCNSGRLSGEQQFRLKGFRSVEVKAIGMDSESDPALVVTFEIFVNNDKVNPIVSQVVSAGQMPPLKADLPEDVFSLTLRTSIEKGQESGCLEGNAVWGTPFVVAAGS
jgi:hypothetical protein